jgi:hypothetical protein
MPYSFEPPADTQPTGYSFEPPDAPSKTKKTKSHIYTPAEVLKEETDKMSGPKKFLTGVGGGMTNLVHGIKQIGATAGNKLGIVSDKTLAGVNEAGTEDRKLMNTLKQGESFYGPGHVGEFVGESAPLMTLPGGVSGGLLKKATTGALAGGAVGGAQFVAPGESRLKNTLYGAGGGAAGVTALHAGGALVNKLVGIKAKGVPFTNKRAEYRAGEVLNDTAPAQEALTGLRKTLGKGAADLPEQITPQVTGGKIISRTLVKATRQKAYYDLGNPSLPVAPIQKEIDAIKSEFRAGDADVHPITFLNDWDRMIEKYSPKPSGILDAKGKPVKSPDLTTVPFEELDSLRKEIGRQLDVDLYGMTPNLTRAKKLTRVKGAIDENIDTNLEHSKQYQKAKNIHSKYMKDYRQGPVGEILAKGNRSTGLRTPVDKVSDKLYTPEGVDGLIGAIGRDGAAEEMMPHVTDRLIKNTVDANTGLMNIPRAMKFVEANKPLLTKLGVADKVDGLVKSQVLKSIEAEFEKSGDVLGLPAMNAKRTRALIRMYGKSVENLFGPEGMKALAQHGEKMASLKPLFLRTPNVEDMTSLVGAFRREKYGVFTGVAEDAARLASVEAGHGWQFASVKGLVTRLADPLLGLSDSKVAEVLLRAERNPDLAKVLREMTNVKSSKLPEVVTKRLTPLLRQIGITGAESMGNIGQPRQEQEPTDGSTP